MTTGDESCIQDAKDGIFQLMKVINGILADKEATEAALGIARQYGSLVAVAMPTILDSIVAWRIEKVAELMANGFSREEAMRLTSK